MLAPRLGTVMTLGAAQFWSPSTQINIRQPLKLPTHFRISRLFDCRTDPTFDLNDRMLDNTNSQHSEHSEQNNQQQIQTMGGPVQLVSGRAFSDFFAIRAIWGTTLH